MASITVARVLHLVVERLGRRSSGEIPHLSDGENFLRPLRGWGKLGHTDHFRIFAKISEVADSLLLTDHELDKSDCGVDYLSAEQVVVVVVVELVGGLLAKDRGPGSWNYSNEVDHRLFARIPAEFVDCLPTRRHGSREIVTERLQHLEVEDALLSVVVLAGALHRHRDCHHWHFEMKVAVVGQHARWPFQHRLLGRREKDEFLYFP